jgi:hypothetical protein
MPILRRLLAGRAEICRFRPLASSRVSLTLSLQNVINARFALVRLEQHFNVADSSRVQSPTRPSSNTPL